MSAAAIRQVEAMALGAAGRPVRDRVIDVVVMVLGAPGSSTGILDEHELRADVDAASVDILELLLCIETAFDIVITDDEWDAVVTVGMLAAFVERKVGEEERLAVRAAGEERS